MVKNDWTVIGPAFLLVHGPKKICCNAGVTNGEIQSGRCVSCAEMGMATVVQKLNRLVNEQSFDNFPSGVRTYSTTVKKRRMSVEVSTD